MADDRVKLGFFLPDFRAGGIEKIVLNLLWRLDPARVSTTLILASRRGALLEQLPPGQAVVDLAGRKMRTAGPALARVLRARQIEVVYSGTNAANLTLLVAAALMARPPRLVVSEHTPIELFFREAKWLAVRRFAMRLLYRRADVIAVPYGALGAELCAALRAPDLAVREFLNPVIEADVVGRAAPRPDHPAAAGRYFVAAGRLEHVKGFDYLIAAFARVAAQHPDLRLVILGEGSERGALLDQARGLGLADRVLLPGHAADPVAWFHHATGLVVSSRREGTPNVMVEAMAAGTPVIATSCSYGPIWLVCDGKAGLVADPRDPGALASAMERLAVDTALAADLRAAGLEQARRFTFDRAIPPLEDAFLALARARRGG